MAQTATETANLFELSCGDTQITYATSSFAGPPQLSYSGPKGDHGFSGGDIDTSISALGTEVTVTLESIPDLHTLTLTVLIAHVTGEQGDEDPITSAAIFTTNHTTIAGSPPVGQSYEVLALEGVAKFVVF